MKTKYIRNGQVILHLNDKGELFTSKDFGSINKAKKESRKLQGPFLGHGVLQVA